MARELGISQKVTIQKYFNLLSTFYGPQLFLSAFSPHIESSHRVDTNYAQFRNKAVGPQWEGRGWSSNLGSHQIPTAAQKCVWRIPKRHRHMLAFLGLKTQSENETKCIHNNREWVRSLNGSYHFPSARLSAQCFTRTNPQRSHFTDQALTGKVICPGLHH